MYSLELSSLVERGEVHASQHTTILISDVCLRNDELISHNVSVTVHPSRNMISLRFQKILDAVDTIITSMFAPTPIISFGRLHNHRLF
jgi:hypothetical protein